MGQLGRERNADDPYFVCYSMAFVDCKNAANALRFKDFFDTQ